MCDLIYGSPSPQRNGRRDPKAESSRGIIPVDLLSADFPGSKSSCSGHSRIVRAHCVRDFQDERTDCVLFLFERVPVAKEDERIDANANPHGIDKR